MTNFYYNSIKKKHNKAVTSGAEPNWNQNRNEMESQRIRWQVSRQLLLLLTLKRQDFSQNFLVKTAFYGLDTEPEP